MTTCKSCGHHISHDCDRGECRPEGAWKVDSVVRAASDTGEELDDGGPAFPCLDDLGATRTDASGMTLRDYLAAHASEDDVAEYRIYGGECGVTREEAKYRYADAMIRARSLSAGGTSNG